ncbi:hypothetical protein FI667_g4461, partial [Globisporangium splendens]
MPVRKRTPKQHPLYAKRQKPSVVDHLDTGSDHSDDVIVVAAAPAVAPHDKPYSRSPFDVSRLPSGVLSRVLAFAVPGYVPVSNCIPKYPSLPVRKLSNAASVSTAWRDAIRKVIQSFRIANLDWTLTAADEEEEYETLQEEVERRGDQLRSIRIRIDGDTKSADVEWDQVFAACPRLKRLDVRGVPLESSVLGLILDAVSSQCHDVQALILSKRSVTTKSTRKAIRANYEKLYQALKKWSPLPSEDTTTTGLKQLTVPDRCEDEYLSPSVDFLVAIAEFCPSLEYLDGWKHAYSVDDFVECDEKWCTPPSTWRQFWESSAGKSLREFNWVVAPFHDAYFRLFAESPKPSLRHLCLTVSESWTWDDFKVPEDEEDSLDAVIAPPTSEALCLVAKAVPHLEQLYVIFHSGVEDPVSVDVEAFGDPFLVSIAESCPSLRELKIVEIKAEQEILPIASITNDGLIALANMKELENVMLTGVRGTSAGVFAFMEHWGTNTQRTVDLGIDQGESGRDFYDAALGVMKRIRERWSEETEENDVEPPKRVVVQLRNLTLEPDFRSGHLKKFCRKGNKLITDLKKSHPWLCITVESDGVEQEGEISAFSTVGKIVFSTRSSNLARLKQLQLLAPARYDLMANDAAASSRKRHAESSDTSESESGYGSVLEETASSASDASDDEYDEDENDDDDDDDDEEEEDNEDGDSCSDEEVAKQSASPTKKNQNDSEDSASDDDKDSDGSAADSDDFE